MVSIVAMWAICHPCRACFQIIPRNAGGVNADAVAGERVGQDADSCPRLRPEARVGNVPQTLKARRGSLARSSPFLQLHLTIIRSGALISASSGSGWVPVRTGGH